jgi:hypothetical protein
VEFFSFKLAGALEPKIYKCASRRRRRCLTLHPSRNERPGEWDQITWSSGFSWPPVNPIGPKPRPASGRRLRTSVLCQNPRQRHRSCLLGLFLVILEKPKSCGYPNFSKGDYAKIASALLKVSSNIKGCLISAWCCFGRNFARNHLNLTIPQEPLRIRISNCLGNDQKSSWASSSESQISIDSR